MRDFLKDFEEPYDRAEWKRFQRQRRGKRRRPIPLVIKLAGIAASLFLMVYASVRLLPLLHDVRKTTPPATHVPRAVPPSAPELPEDSIAVGSLAPATGTIRPLPDTPEKRGERDHRIPNVTLPSLPPGVPSPKAGIPPTEIQPLPLAGSRAVRAAPPSGKNKKPLAISLPKLRPIVGSLPGMGDVNIGVNLTPIAADRGLSLGAGLSAQVQLSNRVSLEIGASYSRFMIGMDREADVSDTVSMQIVGIRNAVGALAVPLSVNYSLTPGFSASLGITPFKVMTAHHTDIMQSYRWVRGDIASGDTTRRLVAERSESKRPDSVYRNNTYLGFVHLSGLISPPVLRRHHIVIAPYVGIPVGRLRADQYRWLHGGVSLRIYLP